MPVSALARFLIVLGLGLGVAGDLLLNVRPWGLNVPLWCALAGSALFVIYRATKVPLTPRLVAAIAAWIVAAALFAWRDADALRAFNLLALTVLTGVLLLELQPRWMAGLDWVRAVGGRLGLMLWRGLDVLETWSKTRLPGSPEAKARHAAVLRGIVYTTPIVLVFGILLTNADAAFNNLLSAFLDFDLDFESGFSHLLGFTGSSWIALGLLSAPGAASFRAVPAPTPTATPAFEFPEAESKPATMIGLTEVGFILGGLVMLFGLFVMVQFRYFFGGWAAIENVNGLSFSEYARRGFFELVTVTALAVPVLLGCRQVTSREGPLGHRLFLVLGGATIAFLGVIMISAWARMGLYVEAFGLTALRLYVSATMIWIGTVLGWLWFTSLRRTHSLFAPGAAALGVLCVFALNAINPDAQIAAFNLARAQRTGDLDLHYLRSLSADAGPAIEDALPRLRKDIKSDVEDTLASMSAEAQRRDWRSWTWGSAKTAKLGSTNSAIAQRSK